MSVLLSMFLFDTDVHVLLALWKLDLTERDE